MCKGHRYKALPLVIINGKGCAVCNKQSQKTTAIYKAETNFEVLEQYVNNKTPIMHKCAKGHVWKAAPANILKGSGCPSCATYGFDSNKPAILYYIKIGSIIK